MVRAAVCIPQMGELFAARDRVGRVGRDCFTFRQWWGSGLLRRRPRWDIQPVQPVPYSHALHAGKLGIDCRYCHTTVEKANFAAIPPTETCMNCHTNIRTQSEALEPIRESWATGKPVEWIKIHDLPHYVYFSHQAHVTHGVGCIECHGRIDQMERVYQAKPLSMGWCLECHRDPGPHLRPEERGGDGYELDAAGGSGGGGEAGGRLCGRIFDSRHGVHAELFDVSSVADLPTEVGRTLKDMKHHSAQREYWRSLEHLANTPAIQECGGRRNSRRMSRMRC